jgi:hypothetical protein
VILKVEEKHLQESISRIYAIKKQIRIFKNIKDKKVDFLTKKTLKSLEKSLTKERLTLSEHIEKGIERLI